MATYNCNTMQSLCSKAAEDISEFDICFESLLREDDFVSAITLLNDTGVTVALGTPPNPGEAVRVIVGGGTAGNLYRVGARITTSLGLIDERVIGVSVYSCD